MNEIFPLPLSMPAGPTLSRMLIDAMLECHRACVNDDNAGVVCAGSRKAREEYAILMWLTASYLGESEVAARYRRYLENPT